MDSIKYIGNGQVVDANGEIHQAPEILKKTRHENFIKVEFMAMTAMINHIGNKKMKVAQYIMDHMSMATNSLIITQTELANKVGVSSKTVEDTIKGLRRANLIRTKTGAIMLSPHLDSKGYPKHYGYLLVKFGQFGNKKQRKNKSKQYKIYPTKAEAKRHNGYYQPAMIKYGKNKKPVKSNN